MTPSPLRLTGRSTSHFTRVVRVFAHELGVPLVLDAVHDLTSLDTASYGGHPALKIPTLHTDDGPLFGTANICQKIAEIAGRSRDPRVVLPHQVTDVLVQSAQELVWHAMGAQVQLIVGLLFAKLPAENVFFSKTSHGLLGALGWLEARLEYVLARLPVPRDTSVFEVSLFCLVDHLVFRPTVPLDAFPCLRAFAAQFAARESAQRTLFRLESAPPG